MFRLSVSSAIALLFAISVGWCDWCDGKWQQTPVAAEAPPSFAGSASAAR